MKDLEDERGDENADIAHVMTAKRSRAEENMDGSPAVMQRDQSKRTLNDNCNIEMR